MSRGNGRLPGKPAKQHLPSKTCPVCQRPFVWRRKWAKDWENVRYCSEACRKSPDKPALDRDN